MKNPFAFPSLSLRMKEHKSLTPLPWWIVGQLVTSLAKTWSKKKGYQLQRLSQPLKAQNVDGSANQGGIICHKVTLYL